VKDCWKLIMKTLHEDNAIEGVFQRESLPEGAYEERYRKNAPELKPLFIRGTKRFLEEQCAFAFSFVTFLEERLPFSRTGIPISWDSSSKLTPRRPIWEGSTDSKIRYELFFFFCY
jgi:hypothetical protein